jgi:hypothetical protein
MAARVAQQKLCLSYYLPIGGEAGQEALYHGTRETDTLIFEGREGFIQKVTGMARFVPITGTCDTDITMAG